LPLDSRTNVLYDERDFERSANQERLVGAGFMTERLVLLRFRTLLWSMIARRCTMTCLSYHIVTLLFSIRLTPLLHSGVIVPHCFLREQGGRKAVFDH
jgi:hypothetical protein